MNALTYWISEHFSLNAWRTSFSGVPVSFGLVGVSYAAWPDYREVTCELLGFGFSLGYWPAGKYGDAEDWG